MKNILENDTSTCWVYLLIQNQSSFWRNSHFSSWTQPAIERLMSNFPLSNLLMEVDVSSSLGKILLAQAFPKCESLIHQQHLTCESLGFSVFFKNSSKTHDLHIFGRISPNSVMSFHVSKRPSSNKKKSCSSPQHLPPDLQNPNG